jgi:hypothetical protein
MYLDLLNFNFSTFATFLTEHSLSVDLDVVLELVEAVEHFAAARVLAERARELFGAVQLKNAS